MIKEISLVRYFKEFISRIWIVILLTVVCAAIMFTYFNFFATPMYTSEAKMFINNRTDSSSGTISSTDLIARATLVKTYAEIVKSNTIMKKVCDKIEEYKNLPGYEYLLDANYTPKQLANQAEVTSANETEVFYIRLATPDPYESQFIVAAITEYLPPMIHDIMEASSARMVDAAEFSSTPSSPNVLRNTILGGGIGFVIAAIIIFLLLMTDTVVRSEETLTEAFDDVIVLGTIPLMHLDIDRPNSNEQRPSR